MSSDAPAAVQAKPGCPDKHRAIVERAMAAMPPAWRLAPQTGEVFDSLQLFEDRVRAWSFCDGFEVVRGGGGSKKWPGLRLQCKHHGEETQNTRKLEDNVVKDVKDKITSDRQRENTIVSQLSCEWAVRCTYKSVGKRGSDEKAWILSVIWDSHSHPLMADPLTYISHRHSTTEFREQLVNIRTHREMIISYSTSRRVLEDEEYRLIITAKEYYNQVRKQPADKNKPKIIEGMIVALQKTGFVYRTRVDIEEDGSGTMISKSFVQIFFTHRKQLEAAKRFVSSFLLVIDGTFNTNDLRFPLLVIVGVLNTGRTFPVAFSFCPSESREAFDFVWGSLKEECFTSEVALPRVVLGDWTPGFISSVPAAFPDAQLQGCDWHAVQAMVKWFRLHGYVSTEIDGYITVDTPSVYIDGLERMAWGYVKSMTVEELDSNRAYLVENLKPEHRHYILEHWQKLETRVIHCHTKFYPNLGSTSSQRAEGYHDSVREITNGQLSLEAATKRLISKTLSVLREIEIDEERSFRGYPRLLQTDSRAFANLKCTITIYAAQMIESQWKELRQALTANEDIEDSSYRCQVLLRFGLPCKHVLKRAFDTGEPIPRSLVHPRYWLQGPIIHAREWQPRYADDARTDYMSEEHWKSSDKIEELARLRDAMKPEERSRYDAQIERVQDNLINIGKNVLIEQDLPIGMPDPAPKHKGRKVKLHSTSNRLETGPETAKRLQLAQEKAQRRAAREAAEAAEAQAIGQAGQTDEQRAAGEQDRTAGESDEEEEDETNEAGPELSEDLIEIASGLLERPSTPPQRKRTHTLVSRTPTTTATPPRPPPPRASTPIEEDLYELPTSTAPARLAPGGRPRRERVPTERVKAARRAGWLPEAQARE